MKLGNVCIQVTVVLRKKIRGTQLQSLRVCQMRSRQTKSSSQQKVCLHQVQEAAPALNFQIYEDHHLAGQLELGFLPCQCGQDQMDNHRPFAPLSRWTLTYGQQTCLEWIAPHLPCRVPSRTLPAAQAGPHTAVSHGHDASPGHWYALTQVRSLSKWISGCYADHAVENTFLVAQPMQLVAHTSQEA